MTTSNKKYLYLVQQWLLALCVSLLFCITMIRGIDFIYKAPRVPYFSIEMSEEEHENNLHEWAIKIKDYYRNYMYISVLIGCLLIIVGSLTPINFLRLGFTIGGIIIGMLGSWFYCSMFKPFVQNTGMGLIFLMFMIVSYYFLYQKKYKFYQK